MRLQRRADVLRHLGDERRRMSVVAILAGDGHRFDHPAQLTEDAIAHVHGGEEFGPALMPERAARGIAVLLELSEQSLGGFHVHRDRVRASRRH
jgi:hypothetical protein